MITARPDAVPRISRRQGGVFTAEQALAEGWTVRQIRRRLAAKQWRWVVGGALVAGDEPVTPLGRAWAAALRWPHAVCVLRSAAALWNLPVTDDGLLHLTGPVGQRARGVRLHDVPIPENEMIILRGGLRITSRRRTVLDCLAGLEFSEALDLYAWASTREVLGRRDVTAALRERLGRPGARQLRRLLDVTASGAVSAAEYRLHSIMTAAGLTGWWAGAKVCDGGEVIAAVDVLFPDAKLVIEVDGERAHSKRENFIRDRQRQNRLVNAGYRVLRFTWWDLTNRPGDVIREIRAALAA